MFVETSLDGIIVRELGASLAEEEGQDYGFRELVNSVEALVLDERTYDTALTFDEWPFADKPCIVLSSREGSARHGARFFAGEPGRLALELGLAGLERVCVDGERAIRSFLRHGLVDDLVVSIHPVVRGRGIRLFGPGPPELWLTLQSVQRMPSGLVQLRYTRAPARDAGGSPPRTTAL